MPRLLASLASLTVASAISACGPGGAAPASSGPGPVSLRALGTEPFWSVEVRGTLLTYSTPEAEDRPVSAVTRSDTGRETVFEGQLEGAPFSLTITRGPCSDGMSDRRYDYIARLQAIGRAMQGCALPLE